MLVHLDDLVGMTDGHFLFFPISLAVKNMSYSFLITDQHDFAIKLPGGSQCAQDDLLRSVIAPHGVDCNPHQESLLRAGHAFTRKSRIARADGNPPP